MSIIIRPTPGVFQRTMPLVVVFGAHRKIDGEKPLDRADHETITEGIALARRLRMPLAFSRVVPDDSSSTAGIWLPDCRPKITDRVFDHPEGSCFRNREFLNVFTTIIEREIYFLGPRSDSSMQASFEESKRSGRSVTVVTPTHPLQKCSTAPSYRASVFRASRYSEEMRDISFLTWSEKYCSVEYQQAL